MLESSETVVSVKISKSVLQTDKDAVVSAVYIPPFNSVSARLEHFDELQDIILNNDQNDNYRLFCGDFNAHTAIKSDLCIVDEFVSETFGIDVSKRNSFRMMEAMEESGIPLERYSVDKYNDNGGYGRRLLEICQNNMLCIFNGRVGEDCRIGRETTNQHSVIHYVIGPPFLLCNMTRFQVYDFDPLFSDKHCILCTELKIRKPQSNVNVNHTDNDNECDAVTKPSKWKDDKKS